MASWLPEILFEIVGQGKAPSKDYYQMLITRSQVIFRWWKISLRSGYQSTKPGEVKESHEDFRENSHLQSPFSSLLSQPWTCSFSCLATTSDSAPLISHSLSSAWILGISADLGTSVSGGWNGRELGAEELQDNMEPVSCISSQKWSVHIYNTC
ncbi:F-box only protein 36 isoform X3 [Myotis myotis]|uniref:F-box only protein 36 isoform X3 n=1 Tax=Myotis myotis TaxID=51298 RepID=UPI00174D80DF|nr:F-box only protein 36 isoform X3 [Myotis myotis]